MQDTGGSVSWTLHPSPATLYPRFAHALARGPQDTVVLFGGTASYFGPVLGDCWVFDSAAGTWTEYAGMRPPATTNASMRYDSVREVTVLVHPNDSTWEWNGFRWREIPIANAPAWSVPRLAFDVNNGMRAFKVSPNSVSEYSYSPSPAKFEITLAQTCSQVGGQPLLLDAFEADLPLIGEIMDLLASGMLPTSLLVGGLELSNGVTTPLGCGCVLGIDPAGTVFSLLPGTGSNRLWSFAIPNDPSLGGIMLNAQAFAVEPTNACFVTASPRATLTVGP